MIKALRGNAKEHKVVIPGKYGNDGSIIDLLTEKPFQQLINKHVRSMG